MTRVCAALNGIDRPFFSVEALAEFTRSAYLALADRLPGEPQLLSVSACPVRVPTPQANRSVRSMLEGLAATSTHAPRTAVSRACVYRRRLDDLNVGRLNLPVFRRNGDLPHHAHLVVDRSTTGWDLGEFDGRSLDRRPAQKTRWGPVDELKHLAKVRVAGSNPVFRSMCG